jgi:hypothetical protein
MSTYKNVSGDYTITVDNGQGLMTINGDLNVRGNATYIDVKELKVDDPFITVAANNSGSGSGAAFPEQGLVAQTGTGTYAGLRFNNPTSTWQISPSVDANGSPISAYFDIASASSASPGAPENAVQFNVGNSFTGSADFLFDAGNVQLTLVGHQIFGNIGSAPPAVANSVAVYHNQVGGGGTGLYARTSAAQGELVNKSKAIIFGLIF